MDHIEGRTQPGGSVLYGARVAKKLGLDAAIWTSAANDFSFPEGITVQSIPSPETTTFTLEYDEVTRARSLACRPIADSITKPFLPKAFRDSRRVLIAPVVNEVGPECVTWFSTRFVGLTPQGWFRDRDSKGDVTFGARKYNTLPRKVSLVVVSREDISGDPSAWDWLKSIAGVAVVTDGRKGYTLSEGKKEEFYPPPYVAKEIDPTGAGDTFATAMLIALSEGADALEAARFGSAAASFVVEKRGFEGLPDRDRVRRRLHLST